MKRIHNRSHEPWTPEEDTRLRDCWGVTSPRTLVARFGRSFAAIANRAGTLGFSRVPQGYVTTPELMRRVGYTRQVVIRVLLAGKVHPVRSYGTNGTIRARPYWPWDEAREAFERYTRGAVTPTMAHRELGVSDDTLYRLVRVACASGRLRAVEPEAPQKNEHRPRSCVTVERQHRYYIEDLRLLVEEYRQTPDGKRGVATAAGIARARSTR